MSISLNVLCPNARRTQIKVQPNTKVLEIIEEVCKKQGFDPSEYCLIHQKKTLDITLSFRLTGVPNNGHLELQKLEGGPRIFNDVTLVLQLDDGSRLSAKSFPPNTTSLENVINAYKSECELLQCVFNEDLARETETFPICIYLTEQIIGMNQLRNTTLKDLGLLNGRGIIRFSFKNLKMDEFEKLEQEFNLKLCKKIKLEQVFLKQKEEQIRSLNNKQETDTKETEPIVQPMDLAHTDAIIRDINFESIQDRVQAQSTSNKKPRPTNSISLEPEAFSVQPNEFLNFKFPEETKGKNLNNINELAEIERESREACDRQAVLYNMDETAQRKKNAESGDVPEDFFEITANDLRYMVNDLKRIQNEESVLMTKQMRELEQDKKAMRYSKVAVRICFKNRQILQGLFRPKELVSSLYNFVKQSFTDDNSKDDLDFYLYTTPPKTEINDKKKTLFESKLCPASFVYFKNKTDLVPRFDPSINCVSFENAEEIVNVQVHQAIREIDHEGMNWLQHEQTVVQNIMKSSGITSTQPHSRPLASLAASSNSDREPANKEANKKLEFFLKGKK